MNLIDALRVSGYAKCNEHESLVYFFQNDELCYRGLTGDGISTLSVWEVLHINWQPYEEPCKHEPNTFTLNCCDQNIRPFCKHCGIKIKAEKWIESV